MVLLGLIGQSMAMAMAPMGDDPRPMAASTASMDCMDMSLGAVPGNLTGTKMTQQCLAAMGYAVPAIVEHAAAATAAPCLDRQLASATVPPRLTGRSFGPEPDPPSILI